jgi:hypothetical protein
MNGFKKIYFEIAIILVVFIVNLYVSYCIYFQPLLPIKMISGMDLTSLGNMTLLISLIYYPRLGINIRIIEIIIIGILCPFAYFVLMPIVNTILPLDNVMNCILVIWTMFIFSFVIGLLYLILTKSIRKSRRMSV